ncbi:hypothetical protein [Spiroplasma alleghenense]|uniref:Uncharacterized protein n=1 Tax=Spiroplasma alleghenense TaxID=216931 RepID=A0A345Z4Y7_9MOLU|nr:hypothetical protein [Spiroplasma alleghenense]AXK51666.1 hypothetical protein SALLE_v1c09960 [Spiroplasma alleghenense]
MRKILSTLSILIPTLVASNRVVSCIGRTDINKNVQVRDLGYLENLKSETVLNAFREKNPRAQHDYLIFGGDTHKGVIRSYATKAYKGEINVTYTTKISFMKINSEDEYFCEINSFEDECVVEAKLLVPKEEISEQDKIDFSFAVKDDLSLRYELIDDLDVKIYFFIDKNKPFKNKDTNRVYIRWYGNWVWISEIYVDIK